MAKAIARSGLGVRAQVTMDGVVHTLRVVHLAHDETQEVEGQIVVVPAVPYVSFVLADLPRRPKNGDVVVYPDDGDETWKVIGDGRETGDGGIECPVRSVTP